jgi:light-regulated signal transduction histidine kinase (bacteriophytochrome)
MREITAGDPARRAEIVVHPELGAVGDRVLLRAVLANLLGNAWKYTSKRADPRIELGRSGEEAGQPIFFVKDNGAGFDMKYAGKLFGVFQRLHKQDQFPGNGVGLATVEKIVSRHGGRIWADACPGEGATFFFTLPAEG